jgi:UDP-N-acetylglucosamine--N-acetylmuramyl-(pentapeptide) pyrophosphoryl-undecaprenol N-acetylglucosamine transferase
MMPVAEKIIFAGGGTGGHVYPALACIETLQTKGKFEVLYVGGYQGIENKIIPEYDYRFKKIWISGFQRSLTLKNILFPFKLIISLLQSVLILMKFKPAVVVGTGGYVSGPVVYSASKMGIPTLIQEQDTFPGVTTRILSKYCDIVCVPYEEVIPLLSKVKGAVVVTGVPIRHSLQLPDKEVALKEWDFRASMPVILIFGGSQGAQPLNLAVNNIYGKIAKKFQVQLLWQTGDKNYEEIRKWPVAANSGVLIKNYIHSMEKAYAAADLIISRAGAISLAELSKVQKPCILVPYPYSAAQHQEKNAETIAKLGAAIVVKEGEGFEERLLNTMDKVLSDPQLAADMGRKWKAIYKPQASKKIVAEIIKLMAEKDDHTTRKN